MKTRLVALFAILLTITITSLGPVLAFESTGDVCKNNTESSICQSYNSNNGKNPIAGKDGIIAKAIRVLSFVVGVASVIMIIFGGFRFVKSNGDSTKVNEARRTIIYSLVAVLVVVFSNVILSFVTGRLF